MDNRRLLIWAIFGLLAWITYQTWQETYGPKPAPVPAADAIEVIEDTNDALPAVPTDDELPIVSDSRRGTGGAGCFAGCRRGKCGAGCSRRH